MLQESIFKAYDIRGIVDDELSEHATYLIGLAFAQKTQGTVVVGYDGRLSSPRLAEALVGGLKDGGRNVVLIGLVPTPVLYFATQHFGSGTGIMVTGSHNPPEYNGLKMMVEGKTLFGRDIKALYHTIEDGSLEKFVHKKGSLTHKNIKDTYLSAVVQNIKLHRPIELVVDCGHGVAGAWAPELFQSLGCKVHGLYCEVDGHFPAHHPDPSKPENLHDVIKTLENSPHAELGLAFDGDADRLGVVNAQWDILYSDQLLMIFAQAVLEQHAGAKVVYDIKCSKHVASWIQDHQGVPVLSKTGHSFIKQCMREEQALLGGEMSGHLFFRDRWNGFDDALYAGARLLEILSSLPEKHSSWYQHLPHSISTPEINLPCLGTSSPHVVIDRLLADAHLLFSDAKEIITLDGIRVEYPNGFGLVRASNTTPVFVLRFEGDHQEDLDRIQKKMYDVLQTLGIQKPSVTDPSGVPCWIL